MIAAIAAMGAFVLLFIALMTLCLTNVDAQFKIIGLLNVAAKNEVAIDAMLPHQSNAQGRGFSVDIRGNVTREKPFSPSLNLQNNFIKVRVIENESNNSVFTSPKTLQHTKTGKN